jgi:uridine phosphorylase
VITVGSENRAEKIAEFLDATPPYKKITSGRGFTTITGFYQGVNVSIVAIGMVKILCLIEKIYS